LPVNKALLDTDILSEIIKGFDQNVARNSAAYYQAFGQFTLSAVTVMEIVQGFEKNQSVRKLQSFMALVAAEEVIDFDRADGALAGRIAGELDRTGHPIGAADTMIAAIALHHGLELVTGNTAHFQRVQQLGYPLTLANWRI
jgi:tRNA(fMet)-specific endonuclease VapC